LYLLFVDRVARPPARTVAQRASTSFNVESMISLQQRQGFGALGPSLYDDSACSVFDVVRDAGAFMTQLLSAVRTNYWRDTVWQYLSGGGGASSVEQVGATCWSVPA